MRAKIGLLIAVLMAVGFGFALYQVTAQSAGASCTFRGFVATVRQGLSQGKTFSGRLTITADADGALSGTFTSTDGATTAPVVGQVDGHALNLAFDLGSGQYLFGAATMLTSFPDCSGAIAGPFVGPQTADSGDWTANGG